MFFLATSKITASKIFLKKLCKNFYLCYNISVGGNNYLQESEKKNMDEILLYLSLKNNGQWIAIYDSLQKREQFSVSQVEKAIDEVDCSFITLIDQKYCENLKSIYKPPFGIYAYGNYNLVNDKQTLTIFADKNNDKEIKLLKENGFKLLWVNPSNKDMVEILKNYNKDNIFWLPEIKNQDNKTYQNLLINQDYIFDNVWVSEIWERKADIDYSSQANERIYLGLTKQVLILKPLKQKEVLAIANYAKNEDILVVFAENVFDKKYEKLFVNAKMKIVKTSEILNPFMEK